MTSIFDELKADTNQMIFKWRRHMNKPSKPSNTNGFSLFPPETRPPVWCEMARAVCLWGRPSSAEKPDSFHIRLWSDL
jgi:hypothetical protein